MNKKMNCLLRVKTIQSRIFNSIFQFLRLHPQKDECLLCHGSKDKHRKCPKFEKKVPQGKIAKVYYVDDDGNKTDMNAVFADGKVTFTTNHFSTYAVIFEDVINTVSPEKSGLSGGAIAGIIVGSVVGAALIAFGIVLLIRKKRSPKKETEEEEVKE